MRFKLWLENSEDLAYLLNPPSQTPHIGPEKVINQAYVSPNGSYRYLYFIENQPVSALQLVSQDGKIAQIANVYTKPEFRRQGLARKLLEKASKDFQSIIHANHLTDLGKLWKKGVTS